MTAANNTAWPYRSVLILSAIALILGGMSMMFEDWRGSALLVGAIIIIISAAVRFWNYWPRRT
jgi:hypothetical protein